MRHSRNAPNAPGACQYAASSVTRGRRSSGSPAAARGGAAARRLEPEQLHLRQPALGGVREQAGELVEVLARDDDVDADLALVRAQRADRVIGAREAVEAAHRGVRGAEPVERDVDLAEAVGDREQALEAVEARRRQVRDDAAPARVLRQLAEP